MLNNYNIKNGIVYFEPEVIAYGYSKHETEKVWQYRRSFELKKRGLSVTKIAKKLNTPRHRIDTWFYKEVKPISIKAIELAKKKKWLPCSTKDKKFKTMLDIFAWIYGDGHLHKDGYVALSGQRKDLEKIRNRIYKDLKLKSTIVWDPGKAVNTSKDTCKLTILEGCRKFGRLLIALGAPVGKKVHRDFYIPDWLMRADIGVQKRFLEVFFSNEITVRKIERKGYVPNFEVRIDKSKDHLESGLIFFNQTAKILSKFNIEAFVYKRKDKRKNNFTISLVINKELPNLFRFYKNFRLIYSAKKRRSLEIIGRVVVEKIRKHLQDINNYKIAMNLRKKYGFGRKRASKILNLNVHLVDGWYRRNCKPIYLKREKELIELIGDKYAEN